jgi:hypothetical protein
MATGCGPLARSRTTVCDGSLSRSSADGGDRSDFTEPCRICCTQRLPPKAPTTAGGAEDGQRKHGEGEPRRPTGIRPRPVTHPNRGLPRSAEGRVCHACFISMAHSQGRLALYAAAWVRCLSTALMGMGERVAPQPRTGYSLTSVSGSSRRHRGRPQEPPRVFWLLRGIR